MTDTHLNALLDRYLHKYIPANHPAQQQHRAQQQQQQQQQQQTQAAFGASQPASASFAPASTSISSGGGSSLHSSVFNAPAAAPATSYAAPAPSAAPISQPHADPPVAPSDLFRQTDLSLIQSQIDNLSAKLQRPTGGGSSSSSQAASELAQLQASMQSNPAARAAFPLMTQPQPIVATQPQPQQPQQQLHMHELDQSMLRAGSGPTPPLQSSSFTQAQTTQNYLQAQQSINSSIQAFSPARPAAAAKQQQQLQQLSLDMTAAAEGGSFVPVPYPSPTGGVRAQLTAANKQIAKQSGLLSEKDFQLASAQRELTSLRSRFDAARTALESHQSLVAEHAALTQNLARSEKIRREQLEYIQMLHAQINFLQNSNASIRASPAKSRQDEQSSFTSPNGAPPQQLQQHHLNESTMLHSFAHPPPPSAHAQHAEYNASQSFIVPAAQPEVHPAPSAAAAEYESKWDAAGAASSSEFDDGDVDPSRSLAADSSRDASSAFDAAEIAGMVRAHAAANGFQAPRAASAASRRTHPQMGFSSARPAAPVPTVPRSRTGFGSSSHKKIGTHAPPASVSTANTPRPTQPPSAASSFSSNRGGGSGMVASSQKKKAVAGSAAAVKATPQRSSSRPPSSFGSAIKTVRPSSSASSSRASSTKKPAAAAATRTRDHFV